MNWLWTASFTVCMALIVYQIILIRQYRRIMMLLKYIVVKNFVMSHMPLVHMWRPMLGNVNIKIRPYGVMMDTHVED